MVLTKRGQVPSENLGPVETPVLSRRLHSAQPAAPATAPTTAPSTAAQAWTPPPPTGDSPFLGQTLDQIERLAIEATLTEAGGNRTRAAEKLGISIRTLRNKLREYRGDAAEGDDDE